MFAPEILVTGASGMLGGALRRSAPHALSHKILWVGGPRSVSAGDRHGFIGGDLSDEGFVHRIISENPNVRVVVHCAANTNVQACEQDFLTSIKDNALGVERMARSFRRFARNPVPRMIYVSTDAVYPDSVLSKGEDLLPVPRSNYGIAKLAGEHLVQKNFDNHLILRTTIVGFAEGHFLDWVKMSALSGKPYSLFDDVYFSPLAVSQLAAFIWALLFRDDIRGVFNASSSESCSKAHLATQFLASLGIGLGLGKVESSRQFQNSTARSANMSMNSDRLGSVLGGMPNIAEVVKAAVLEFKLGGN